MKRSPLLALTIACLAVAAAWYFVPSREHATETAAGVANKEPPTAPNAADAAPLLDQGPLQQRTLADGPVAPTHGAQSPTPPATTPSPAAAPSPRPTARATPEEASLPPDEFEKALEVRYGNMKPEEKQAIFEALRDALNASAELSTDDPARLQASEAELLQREAAWLKAHSGSRE